MQVYLSIYNLLVMPDVLKVWTDEWNTQRGPLGVKCPMQCYVGVFQQHSQSVSQSVRIWYLQHSGQWLTGYCQIKGFLCTGRLLIYNQCRDKNCYKNWKYTKIGFTNLQISRVICSFCVKSKQTEVPDCPGCRHCMFML